MTINYGYGNTSHTHSLSPPSSWEGLAVASSGWDPAGHYVVPTPSKRVETTAQTIARERREARERQKLEAAYEAWDALELDQMEERTVLMFDVDHGRDHDYTYVALKVDQRWFLTGSRLNGGSTEDFLAWLIQNHVSPDDVSILEGHDD